MRPIFIITIILYFLLGFYIGKDRGVAEERRTALQLVEKKKQEKVEEYLFYMRVAHCLKYTTLDAQDSCALATK